MVDGTSDRGDWGAGEGSMERDACAICGILK